MTTNLRRVLLLLAGLAVLAPADATEPTARRPGQWEMQQGVVGARAHPAIRFCMSAAEAGGEFRGIGRGVAAPASTCDYQRLATSASEVRWRSVCRSGGDTLTMDGRAYDIRAESFKADMTMRWPGGAAGTVHAEARWLSADCGRAN